MLECCFDIADHVQRAVAQNHAVFTRMLDGKLHTVFDDAASRRGLSEAAQVGGKIGCLTVLLGIFLLLALVLPPGFWWFVLGVLLIFVGFWIMRCR